MGWNDAKIAGKEAFKESSSQVADGKVKPKDTAKSAQKVANKVEKEKKEKAKQDKEKK